MIDAERLGGFLLADGANAMLSRQENLIFLIPYFFLSWRPRTPLALAAINFALNSGSVAYLRRRCELMLSLWAAT